MEWHKIGSISLLIFLKTVLLCWHLVWSNFSVSAYEQLSFLPVLSRSICNLFLRRVSALTTALHSCHCKAFETILRKNTLKHISTSSLPFDRQYMFRKGRSSGDLTSLTDSLSRFLDIFAVASDMSKAFDRIFLWFASLREGSIRKPFLLDLLTLLTFLFPFFSFNLWGSAKRVFVYLLPPWAVSFTIR